MQQRYLEPECTSCNFLTSNSDLAAMLLNHCLANRQSKSKPLAIPLSSLFESIEYRRQRIGRNAGSLIAKL